MEVRLNIFELIIVVMGLLTSGAILGIAIANDFSRPSGLYYSAGILLVSLSVIMRKRYKLAK